MEGQCPRARPWTGREESRMARAQQPVPLRDQAGTRRLAGGR